eukprot:1161939-Pelagomonas_calceolata.AAC.8
MLQQSSLRAGIRSTCMGTLSEHQLSTPMLPSHTKQRNTGGSCPGAACWQWCVLARPRKATTHSKLPVHVDAQAQSGTGRQCTDRHPCHFACKHVRSRKSALKLIRAPWPSLALPPFYAKHSKSIPKQAFPGSMACDPKTTSG